MAALQDLGVNPRVASLKESKTMALTDLARSMKEEGKPARREHLHVRQAAPDAHRRRSSAWLRASRTLTRPLQ